MKVIRKCKKIVIGSKVVNTIPFRLNHFVRVQRDSYRKETHLHLCEQKRVGITVITPFFLRAIKINSLSEQKECEAETYSS